MQAYYLLVSYRFSEYKRKWTEPLGSGVWTSLSFRPNGGTEESHETLNQEGRCRGRDSNRALSQYKFRALPLDQYVRSLSIDLEVTAEFFLLLLVSCVAYSSTLNIEAICYSETPVESSRPTQRYIQNGRIIYVVRICEWKWRQRAVLSSGM
jgi:hypothetical protein